MTHTLLDLADAPSLASFSGIVDELAAKHRTTRLDILQQMIAELEDEIAVEQTLLGLARRLESAERPIAASLSLDRKVPGI